MVGCWLQTSVVGWLANLAVLAMLLLLTRVYARPGPYLLPAPFAWVYPACGVAGLLSATRLGALGWPHVSSMAMGALVFTVILVVYVVAGLREPAADGVTEMLAFPLRSGRWTVMTGGVRALNHHLHAPNQAGALDLIGVRPDGARAQGVCPDRLEGYQAYGREVVSPCDGVVVTAVGDLPDQQPQRLRAVPVSGNHISIDTGRSIVHLSHLRPGTVRVATGDRVVTGQPLGEVGNSGRSTEPHLHIHAEHGGRALRLRFTDLPRPRLRPGVVVTAGSGARSR
jgi:hypothetical protein